ncbi:MAG TPA: hypothetical protein VF906_05505 [Candidatus Bathyarchaeia archaeon]
MLRMQLPGHILNLVASHQGLILGGASGATIFLVRYDAQNRRLRNMLDGRSITTANQRHSMSSQSRRVIRNGPESRFLERRAESHHYDD